MLRPEDLELLKNKGITEEQVESQLKRFETGFPYLEISAAARHGQGITVLTPEAEEAAVARWDKYLADGGEVAKFVPASGAASRMFKALFEFVDGNSDTAAEGTPVAKLLADPTSFRSAPTLTLPVAGSITFRLTNSLPPDAIRKSSLPSFFPTE